MADLGEINGAALRMHFATPFGGLLVSGGRFNAPMWAGFVALVLVHEVGHAVAVWRSGLKVLGIDLHPVGGLCHYEGFATPLQDSVIAFAGVWAQLLAYAVAQVVLDVFGGDMRQQVKDFVWVFTTPNLVMAAFNMLPVPPLDGPAAWAFFPRLWRRIFRKGRREKIRGKVDALDAVLKKPIEKPVETKKEWMN